MRKVNFVIGGAPKAGSTSLAKIIGELEEVYLHDEGYELQFFGKDRVYRKGIEWYESLFEGRTERWLGEKSTTYILHPEAAARIKDYNPEMKIIFILRNPVDRAYSQYKANISKGTEYLSFDKAIAAEAGRRRLGGFFANNYAYGIRGYYYQQLKRYYDLFPTEQLLVLLFEDLKNDLDGTLRRVCDFLHLSCPTTPAVREKSHSNKTRVPKVAGIPLLFMIYRKYIRKYFGEEEWINRRFYAFESKFYKEGRYERMPEEVRHRLLESFKEPNDRLAELLDRDLSHWQQ